MARRPRTDQQRTSSGGHWPAVLGGIGLGSALFYFLDPSQGRHRRARVRDKATRAAHVGRRDVAQFERDLANRAQGLVARVRARFRDEAPGDEVLEERVRSAIGHVCSHPRAIDVSVDDGKVLLAGPVLQKEHQPVIRQVARVRGVRAVDDVLRPHAGPDGIPSLQGDRQAPPRPWALRRTCCADLMKLEVQIVGETDTIHRAAELMALANVGCLPVCNAQRKVVGTITDRDIVVRLVANDMPATAYQVVDVMTRGPVTCRPDDEITLAEQLMAQHQVSRLPITDPDGTLRGIISLSDIAEHEPMRRAGRTLRAVAAREAPRV
jgi:CBS domain-containing protein